MLVVPDHMSATNTTKSMSYSYSFRKFWLSSYVFCPFYWNICSGVARAFLSEQVAHPEDQNEEENEESLRKNERNYRKMKKDWGKCSISPTREWQAGYSPEYLKNFILFIYHKLVFLLFSIMHSWCVAFMLQFEKSFTTALQIFETDSNRPTNSTKHRTFSCSNLTEGPNKSHSKTRAGRLILNQ